MTAATKINMGSERPKLQKKRQMHSRWFALLVIPLIFFSAGLLKEGSWGEEVVDWVGFTCLLVCVLGRTYSSLFIGGIKNKTVVRSGPFSIVRNPLYVFSFFGVVGIGLQSGRISLLLLLIAAFISYYRVVVRKEEAYLTHKFGEDYLRYMQEVPRWIPKFSLWSEPEEVTARPNFVRQTMMDALIFFVPWLCFEFIGLAQEAGYIPAIILP